MMSDLFPKLACALLIIAMLATLSWQSMRFWQQHQAQVLPATAKPTIMREPTRTNRELVGLKLFGDAQAKTTPAPVEQKEIPKTKLKLTLRGVLAATNEQVASALIEGPDRSTESYKVEQELPGGATLKQVHSDRIVLERNGEFESLYFPEAFSRLLTSDLPALNEDKVDPDSATNTLPARSNVLGETQKQNIKDRLRKLRERIRSG